jgi:hypothetical protein
MNWESIGSIFLGVGFLASLVGFSIRLWPGGWLRGPLLIVLVAVALLSGDWQSPHVDDIDDSSRKSGSYWLIGGFVSLLLGGAIMLITKNLT